MPYHTEAKLFTVGNFTSHAGLPLKWKIECDAISPEQWKALATMIMDYQTDYLDNKKFKRVLFEKFCQKIIELIRKGRRIDIKVTIKNMAKYTFLNEYNKISLSYFTLILL